MLDHVGLTVSDFARSRAFYEAALAPLGMRVMMEPVDFRQIYVQNVKALAAKQAQPTTPAN